MRRLFTLLILLSFSFLSKVHAAEYIYDEAIYDTCDQGPCELGYEGENCETWICDEENKTLIYKCNGNNDEPCIRLDKICDGNEDCKDGEDENTVCQVGYSEL